LCFDAAPVIEANDFIGRAAEIVDESNPPTCRSVHQAMTIVVQGHGWDLENQPGDCIGSP